MKQPRTTRLLVVLLILSAAAATIALPAMNSAKEAAQVVREDLNEVRAALTAMLPLAPSTSPASGTAAPDNGSDATVSIRAAAARAGIESSLAGIESLRRQDAPGGGGGGGSIFLVRFDPISLKNLAALYHEMAGQIPGARADAIELSAARTSADAKEERWSTTVTLAVPTSR